MSSKSFSRLDSKVAVAGSGLISYQNRLRFGRLCEPPPSTNAEN